MLWLKAHCLMCLTKRLLSEPLLSVGTGVQEFNRYPSTVNRVLVSCSGVIGNSLLLVCHTERRPQSPCSMWEQELNRYPDCRVVSRDVVIWGQLQLSFHTFWKLSCGSHSNVTIKRGFYTSHIIYTIIDIYLTVGSESLNVLQPLLNGDKIDRD